MGKGILTHIAKLFTWVLAMLVLTASAGTIVLSNNSALTAKAANTDNESSDFLSETDYVMYNDVNTLGATVSVKSIYLKVKANNAAQSPKPTKVTVNGKALKLNKDYTLAYQKYSYNSYTQYEQWNNVNSMTGTGTYRICVIGKGNYSGVCVKRIYVYDPAKKVPMSSVKVTVNKVPYTGKPITSGVIKSIKYKNVDVTEGCGLTYLQNVDSGTGIVRIEGTGKFVGEKEVKFQITGGTKITKAKITGIAAKTYDCGNELTQDMSKVKVVIAGKELTYGTDYDISYTNNKKAGTAKISFTGKGAYYGTVTKSFKVGKVKLSEDMLGKASKSIMVKYTKKAVKPDVTLYNARGEQLVKGVDYTLAYKNNVKISDKAVVTVKGKGSYTGSFKVNFTITDKDIVEQPDEDGKPSGDSGEGEKPSEGSDEGKTDEGEKPNEGSNEGEKPSEGSSEDNPTGGDGEDESGESKPDDNGTDDGDDVEAPKKVLHMNGVEVEVPEKPIAFRVCNCGQMMPVFVYGVADEELEAWCAHSDQHMMNGEPTNHSSASYEKALKYHFITEDMVFQPCTFFKP
ncbi:MAG: hypothetical protein K2O32_05430 [Acetatifactor sp.]|nr:hypothetical protein [Acetatifactor sp.]